MSLKSIAALSETLQALGLVTKGFTARTYPRLKQKEVFSPGYSMSDETYGSKSFVYIGTPSRQARQELEQQLEKAGFKIKKEYSPDRNTVEVQVSYFQGWHHDE